MEFEESQRSSNETDSEERALAAIVYASALVAPLLAPLIIWLVKKNESRLIDHHGRQYFNCLISYTIYGVLLAFTFGLAALFPPFLLLTILGYVVLGLGHLAVNIIAAIKAYEGKYYEIPFCIKLL